MVFDVKQHTFWTQLGFQLAIMYVGLKGQQLAMLAIAFVLKPKTISKNEANKILRVIDENLFHKRLAEINQQARGYHSNIVVKVTKN